jgi:hypothetical protein
MQVAGLPEPHADDGLAHRDHPARQQKRKGPNHEFV